MAKLLEDIHPGEILLEEFMKPMGIRARRVADRELRAKPSPRIRVFQPVAA